MAWHAGANVAMKMPHYYNAIMEYMHQKYGASATSQLMDAAQR